MTRATMDDGLSKFQRYRQTRARSGMKLLRVWVLDPRAPEFQAEAARQSFALRGASEEAEALHFIGDALDWSDV